MCNLSEGVWEEGWAEGREESLMSALKNLMKNMGLSAEQAMDALSVPESDRPKYAAKLQKE